MIITLGIASASLTIIGVCETTLELVCYYNYYYRNGELVLKGLIAS